MIKNNLDFLKEKINNQDIKIVAVSKTQPIELLQEAYDAGVRDFGENKIQEIQEKYELLPADVRWHMIGHLQTNKVKYIVDKVYLIHSVDSEKLASQINKEAQKKNCIVQVLVQVNISGEKSKYGIEPEMTEGFIRKISLNENLRVLGLMTVAPFTENPEDNRIFFRKMKQLYVDIRRKNIDNVNMSVLSMGMTGDYEVAIQEGATVIRVGTGIFGERHYE